MSSRFLPPATCAACLLAVAVSVAGEIPFYEDFSHPLSFSAVSGGRGEEGGTLPARADIAISFLAQDEDTWFDRLLVHHSAGSGGIAPYTPPIAPSSGRETASSRNWLADALANKTLPGLTDIASAQDDSGDWLSGDLAQMARKREAKANAEKERTLDEEPLEQDDPAALWNPADASRIPPFAAAARTGESPAPQPAETAATRRPAEKEGTARASRDGFGRGTETLRRTGGNAPEPDEPEELPPSGGMIRALASGAGSGTTGTAGWRDGTETGGTANAPASEKRDNPAWMQAILDAGRPPPSVSSWSAPTRADTAVPAPQKGFPSHADGGTAAEHAAGDRWANLRREAPASGTQSGWPAAGATAGSSGGGWTAAGTTANGRGGGWTPAGTGNGGWALPDRPVAATHAGWHGGGWGSQSGVSGNGGFSLPAAPVLPSPSARRTSAMPTNAVLPRPAWY